MIIEIVILAMVAAFLGLRLYSVLGRRAEHEEEPIPTRFDSADKPAQAAEPRQIRPASAANSAEQLEGVPPGAERGVSQIASADRAFDITAFLEGAKGAYGMVLEAYWKGDTETLRQMCDRDVYESFSAAIDAREKAGEVLDNRLVRIEEAKIDSARLEDRMARIAVRFVADIAAVTRNKDGDVIAGSLDDAIESRDVWTFMRNVDSPEPNWLLDETDEG